MRCQNFDTQCDRSCRQLWWQEFLSQYDMTIVYIPGKANSVADRLSQVPLNAFLDENDAVVTPHIMWANTMNTVLRITMDTCILDTIKMGYHKDEFCKKLISNRSHANGIHYVNSLQYVSNCLLIPQYSDVHKNIFWLTHNNSGHFGPDKAYTLLCNAYYWLNMQCDLEKSYIPSCTDCQRNKLSTKKSASPLHPLPIPDHQEDSVGIDFIGPLLLDEGYNCIVSIMDQLNSNMYNTDTLWHNCRGPCSCVLQPLVLWKWPTTQHHIQQGQTLHVQILESTTCANWSKTQTVFGVPHRNWWCKWVFQQDN